jgi:predicted Holliday junction resolvase-like endonuclease
MKLEKSKKEKTSKLKKAAQRKTQVNLEQAIKETEKKIEQQIAEREKEIVRVKEPMTLSQNVLAVVVLGAIVLIAWLNG